MYFSDGQILEIARHKIRIIHVPGHTPASSLLVMDEKIVFTGDSMIEGNKIITSFRGGNKDDMLYIAIPRLKQLPDDLMVLPGHGEPFRKEQFDFNIYNVDLLKFKNDKAVITDRNEVLTYGQLSEEVERFASAFLRKVWCLRLREPSRFFCRLCGLYE